MPETDSTTSPTQTDIAYAAGILDGEGTVQIPVHLPSKMKCRKGSISPSFYLQVSVANTDYGVLLWLKKNFGGGVTKMDKSKQSGVRFQCYKWSCYSRIALAFLKMTIPYLQIKKEQAKIAIEFQEGFKPSMGTGRPLAKWETDLRFWFREQIRLLNGRKPTCGINRPKPKQGDFKARPERTSTKLTAEKVVEIKKLLASGVRPPRIAPMFGVGKWAIYSIANGDNWPHVQIPPEETQSPCQCPEKNLPDLG